MNLKTLNDYALANLLAAIKAEQKRREALKERRHG